MVERKIKGVLVVLSILIVVMFLTQYVSSLMCAEGRSPPHCDLDKICYSGGSYLNVNLIACTGDADCTDWRDCNDINDYSYWCYYSGNILTSNDCCWAMPNSDIYTVYKDADGDRYGTSWQTSV